MYILGVPLGFVMRLLYNVLQNYGLTLVVFTLLVKVLTIPLAVKQQKSSAKMAAFRPQLEEIQQKYAKNQQKMSEEMQKLYQKEGYNPMSGCLPALIQFPIIFGLYDVIYKPMTHILHLGSGVIEQAKEIALNLGTVAASAYSMEPSIITAIQNDPAAFSALGSDVITKVQGLDLNFLGINLGVRPELAFNILVLIPILSFATSMLMTVVSMRSTGAQDVSGAGAMKITMYMMPLMSGWIAFQVPAGVGIYWILSNVFSIGQSLILNKMYNPKEMAEKAKAELEAHREQERLERQQAKAMARNGSAEAKEKAMSQKEVNRQKLAEARRRSAEKYGDQYIDGDDEDNN